jgi:DNA-binding transcriptional MerR regulator
MARIMTLDSERRNDQPNGGMKGAQATAAELTAYLEKRDLTVEELVASAESFLAALAPTQARFEVTERPDVRTIRYYTKQRLLPRPVSYEGGRARYAGTHLIRLLLIKKLQAEQQTLRSIAEVLENVTDDDMLKKLLPQREPASASRFACRAYDSPPAPASIRLERIPLIHGGTLDVPSDVLTSAPRRRELAQRLEELARTLRSQKSASGHNGYETGRGNGG